MKPHCYSHGDYIRWSWLRGESHTLRSTVHRKTLLRRDAVPHVGSDGFRISLDRLANVPSCRDGLGRLNRHVPPVLRVSMLLTLQQEDMARLLHVLGNTSARVSHNASAPVSGLYTA